METEEPYILQLGEGREITLEFVNETDGVFKFQATKYNTNLSLNEKSSITITLELSSLTDEERKSVLLYNMYNGKSIPNTEIKITKRHNGK